MKPYNPLDVENLGRSIMGAILERDPVPLGEVPKFQGVGIYAIYYTGEFEPYEPVSRANAGGAFRQPIYVGKAIPPGGRKGVVANDGSVTSRLYTRIQEHAKSVTSVDSLDVADFYVRWLVVEPVWIPLGESLLITATAPVWNVVLDGFGSHTPGKERVGSKIGRWDRVHQGRASMAKLVQHEGPATDLLEEVRIHLERRLGKQSSGEQAQGVRMDLQETGALTTEL